MMSFTAEAVQGIRLAALADGRALWIGERDGQQVRGLLRADVAIGHFAHDVVRLSAREVLPPPGGGLYLADWLVSERAELAQDIQLADRLDELAALVAVASGVLEVDGERVKRLLELAGLFGRRVRSEPHRVAHVPCAEFRFGRNAALPLLLVRPEPSLRSELLAEEEVELFAHRLLRVADALRVYESADELHLGNEPGHGRHGVELRDPLHGRLAAPGVYEVLAELRIDALRGLAEELHGHEVAPHVGVERKAVLLDPLAARELGDETGEVARVLEVERGLGDGGGEDVSVARREVVRRGTVLSVHGGLVLGVASRCGTAVLAVAFVAPGLLARRGHYVVHDGLHLCVDLGLACRLVAVGGAFLVCRHA